MVQSGFTIVEFLVAAAIFAFVALAISTVYVSNQQVYAKGQSRIDAQQNARVAIEQMERELRMAGKDPRNTISTQSPATAIQTATGTSITFLADIDHDRTLDKVTYRLSGGQLLRDFSSWNGSSFPTATTGIIADKITSLTFTYYDAAQPTNNVITAPVASGSLGTIKRIAVGIATSQTTIGASAQTFGASIDVRPRNL